MKIHRFANQIGLFCLFCLSLNTQSLAQNETYRSTLSANVGPNIFGLFDYIDDAIVQNDTLSFTDLRTYGSPTFQLSYDYGIRKWFSLGLAASYNRFGFEATDLDFKSPSTDSFVKGDVSARVSRTGIAVRPLFHYGNNPRLDMYSGVRVGLSVWKTKLSGEGTAKSKDDFEETFDGNFKFISGVFPQLAITAFGLRGYVTEKLGFGFELNLGPTYICSANVNYRY